MVPKTHNRLQKSCALVRYLSLTPLHQNGVVSLYTSTLLLAIRRRHVQFRRFHNRGGQWDLQQKLVSWFLEDLPKYWWHICDIWNYKKKNQIKIIDLEYQMKSNEYIYEWWYQRYSVNDIFWLARIRVNLFKNSTFAATFLIFCLQWFQVEKGHFFKWWHSISQPMVGFFLWSKLVLENLKKYEIYGCFQK